MILPVFEFYKLYIYIYTYIHIRIYVYTYTYSVYVCVYTYGEREELIMLVAVWGGSEALDCAWELFEEIPFSR